MSVVEKETEPPPGRPPTAPIGELARWYERRMLGFYPGVPRVPMHALYDPTWGQFPQGGFPAAMDKLICWDMLASRKSSNIGIQFVKDFPLDAYAPPDDSRCYVQVVLSVPPTSPPYDEFVVEWPGGHVVNRFWRSSVGHPDQLFEATVRGFHVTWECFVWRPLRSAVGLPAVPGAKPREGHDDLFVNFPTLVAAGHAVTPDVDGYCYLLAVPKKLHAFAAASLGWMPDAAAIVEFGETYGWSERGIEIAPAGDRYHMMPGTGKADVLLRNLPPDGKVGSTQATATRDSTVTVEESSNHLEASIGGSGTRFRIPIAGMLTHAIGKHETSVTARALLNAAAIGSYFESVSLLELSLTVSVVVGNSNTMVMVAFDSGLMPTDDVGWAMAPYSLFLTGNEAGGTTGVVELPPGHAFGRELKAASVGNAPPCVHVKVESDDTAKVIVRGHLLVEAVGVGMPGVVNITPSGKGGLLQAVASPGNRPA